MAHATPAANAPAVAEDLLEELKRLKMWEKLRKGELHLITKENVEELFRILDENQRGEISPEQLLVIRQIPELSLTEQDVDDLVKDSDTDQSGKVSPHELYKALTQGEVAFNIVKRSLNKTSKTSKKDECDRGSLIQWLHDEYETNSALWSMPQTIVMFIMFLLAITWHLDRPAAFSMQNALRNEIEGEGRPYLKEYVHDVPSFWGWMETSFASAHFRNDLKDFPYPGRVASYNQIIGGVNLQLTQTVPEECNQNRVLRVMYDTLNGAGRCHKQTAPFEENQFLLYHERVEDIIAQLRGLAATNWISQNSSTLDIGILFYNAHLNIFTAHHQMIDFGADGAVKLSFSQETFMAEPYNNIVWLVPDVIFAVIVIRMFYSEMKELIPACLNGVDGFLAYFGFWNIIDWLSIVFGALIMGLWGFVVTQVSGPLQDAMIEFPAEPLDAMVIGNQTYLTPTGLNEIVPRADIEATILKIHSVMNQISETHEILRTIIFFYGFVMMMKFFKAFRANPRLNIVIQTVLMASTDLIHFFIIFFLIFFVFSSSATVIFGANMKPFSDATRSFMMCWRILMGEFDVENMELVNQTLAYLWFFCFEALVLLVLLNMLLAIIMDTYAAVKTGKTDPISIWAQVRQALRTVRETRGFLDLWYLICEFEDDDYPAHPGKVVRSRSLRRAFEREKMTRHNAEYIIRKTVEFVKEKEGECELTLSDAIRVISLVKTQILKVAEQTEWVMDVMKEERKKPQEARFNAIMSGKEPDQQVAGPGHFPFMPYHAHSFGAMPGQMPLALPGVANGFPQQMQVAHPAAPTRQQTSIDGPGMSSMSTVQFATNSVQVSDVGHMHSTIGDDGHRGGSAKAAASAAAVALEQLRNDQAQSVQQIVGSILQLQAGMEALHGEQRSLSDQIKDQLREQRQYTEQREAWLEQRLNHLERRCEKVERATDRVHVTMQNFDFDQVITNQRKLMNAIEAGGAAQSAVRFARDPDDPQAMIRSNPQVDSARLERRVETLGEQVTELLAHAEEAAEARRLLWKIELGVRQLRGGAGATMTSTQSALPAAAPSESGGSGNGKMATTTGGWHQQREHSGASGGWHQREHSGGLHRAPAGVGPQRSEESAQNGASTQSAMGSALRHTMPSTPPRSSDSPNWGGGADR